MKLATANNPATERLGIGVAKNNDALRELVDYFLNKSFLSQQRGEPTEWQKAYRKHLVQFGPATQPRPDSAPDLVDYDAKSPPP
jgi:glutamate transport system substrate-binding protein